MKRGILWLYFLLCSAAATALPGHPKVIQPVPPVKLPPLLIWRIALGQQVRRTELQERIPRGGIERAWQNYLTADALASRIEMGKWLPDLLEHGGTLDVAAALSVAKLNNAVNTALDQPATSLADDLTQARSEWRKEPGLGSWVDLFDGAIAEEQQSAFTAKQKWNAASNAKDAPLQAQGLAHLGLAQLAIERNAAADALGDLQAAERIFTSAGDVRGVAAAMVLRITAFSASQDAAKADLAAATAESYCRTQGLIDGRIDSLLRAADSASASGDSKKAAERWSRAEDLALYSGLMPIRVLNRGELARLRQYIGPDLSLQKSREYFRWAATTGNFLLIERSSRAMAAALKVSGQTGASGWYGIMAKDAAASLALMPPRTRLLHAALIDYGLLEAGVDPGSRPELFVGRKYEVHCKELIGGLRRIAKFAPEGDEEDLSHTKDLEKLAVRVDRQRESALAALHRNDRQKAAKGFQDFFHSVAPIGARISGLTAQSDESALSQTSDAELTYASGLLRAWAMRDPSLLRSMITELLQAGSIVDAPFLLSAGASSNANTSSQESDSEALSAAVARGRAPAGRPWPRLIARYAATGGGSAVTAAAFGVDPEKLNEQEAAQFQIAYGGQFALAVNGKIPYIQMGEDQSFEWLTRKIHKDYRVRGDIEKVMMLGAMIRIIQMAYLSTDHGAAQLASNKYLRGFFKEEPDMPDFESLDEEDSSKDEDNKQAADNQQDDQTENVNAAETYSPPKGFMQKFGFTVWSMQYPSLMNAVFNPESTAFEKNMANAVAHLQVNPSLTKALLPPEIAQALGNIQETRRLMALDLALSALAGKRYAKAIEWLAKVEGMIPSSATLERVQVKYVEAMCYRGLGNASREETLLSAAGDELEGLRRSVATRSASLRLRDLRQLIEEEYLSVLYRHGNWAGMARAIARYRQASLLPAAILAEDPRNPLVQELETLKDTYDFMAEDSEKTPVSRQDYRELFKLFAIPAKLPSGDPTFNAIEQATYLVTNELYAKMPGTRQTRARIRRAAPGELLILQSVGHAGVHTVTIDEHGHASGYYRYFPIASLEALSTQFEKALQAGGPSGEPGAQLYDKLLAYIPAINGKRRLSILADGPLQNMTWSALPMPNGQYLVEKYEIGILSGALPAPGKSLPPRNHILAITKFDSDIDAIGIALGNTSSEIIPLKNPGITVPNIQKALRSADQVYISTHGQSENLLPDYSFLELTENQRLYSLDLGNLDFNGRKLLLSACDTRTGTTYPGEDVYGLADAFLARNASTVVATQWEVEAPAAAAFARAFYENPRHGSDYTGATAQAARSLLQNEHSEWKATQHWAAYEAVSRFLEIGGNPALLTPGAENQDGKELEILQSEYKHSKAERHLLDEKKAALGAELTEFDKKVTQEEERNSALYTQVLFGRATEKWVAATLKAAKTAFQANPEWKPAEQILLTVRVQDKSGIAIPGAEVSVQDVTRRTQTAHLTDNNGKAFLPDIRTATPYKISVSAKGFQLPFSLDGDQMEGWFSNAEKLVTMQHAQPVVEVRSNPEPKQKAAAKKSLTKQRSRRLPRSGSPLHALLDNINQSEASKDKMQPDIAELEAERASAQDALQVQIQDHQTNGKQIDEYRAKIEQESQELNTILRQVHLTELQPFRVEIAGTVEGSYFRKIQAKVTLKRVGGETEEAISTDTSGHFAFGGAQRGVEYIVTVEADGYIAWKSLPTSFYFPGSLSIMLRKPEDPVYHRSWQ